MPKKPAKKSAPKKSAKKLFKLIAPEKAKIPAPVSEGEEYDLEIEKSQKGNGIGFVKNFPILVPEAEVGDSVHVQIIKVRLDHAVARVMSSEEPQLPGENIEEEYQEAEEKAAAGELPPAESGGEEEEG